jgi:hypothetical protein
MNGRVYDPTIARFLSADPIIQAPHDLQSYNRYAYVRNNPLKYTDPSGYSWLSREWKRAKKRWTRIREGIKGAVVGFFAGGWAGAYVGFNAGYNYRKARDYGLSTSQAQKQGLKAAIVSGITIGTGYYSCGAACATKAAATSYVMQTPTGRSATRSVSQEVFTEFLGIGDQNWSDFLASVALSSGVGYGIQTGIDAFTNAPTITAGNQPIDPSRLNTNDPVYGQFIANQGIGAQGNITDIGIIRAAKGGQVFPVYNAQGDLVGLVGASPAWGGLVTHTAAVIKSPSGQYFNSMRGILTGSSSGAINLYGVTGVCHHMCNVAITQAGYAGQVSTLLNGVRGSTFSSVLYGQHMGTSVIEGILYGNRREYF